MKNAFLSRSKDFWVNFWSFKQLNLLIEPNLKLDSFVLTKIHLRSVLLYGISIFVSRSISFDHCRYLKRNRTYIDFYVLRRIFVCYQNRLPFRKQDIRKLIFEIYSVGFRTKDIFGEVLLIAALPNIIQTYSAWLLTDKWSAPKHTHYFLRRSLTPTTPQSQINKTN